MSIYHLTILLDHGPDLGPDLGKAGTIEPSRSASTLSDPPFCAIAVGAYMYVSLIRFNACLFPKR